MESSPGYTGLKVGEHDLVQLTLYDFDDSLSGGPDLIGTFELRAEDIFTASQMNGIVQLPVADRSQNQVLAVCFIARPSGTTTTRVRGLAVR